VGQTDDINCRETGLRPLVTDNCGQISRTKSEISPKITFSGRLHVIAYRATLDVPREVVWFLAKLLARGAPAARHPARQPGADLLLAGGTGAAVVPGPHRR
jgi:hypothetical protein